MAYLHPDKVMSVQAALAKKKASGSTTDGLGLVAALAAHLVARQQATTAVQRVHQSLFGNPAQGYQDAMDRQSAQSAQAHSSQVGGL